MPVLVLMVGILLVMGCGEDPVDTALADCAEDTNWTTVGAPFVYTWCTPCHSPDLKGADARQGATEGVNFASYDDVVSRADRFEIRVFAESGPMPPTGGPSEADLAAVAAWLECGMPE